MTMTRTPIRNGAATARSGDDLVRWPDGTEATWEEVERGDYNWMSDDYEVIPFKET